MLSLYSLTLLENDGENGRQRKEFLEGKKGNLFTFLFCIEMQKPFEHDDYDHRMIIKYVFSTRFLWKRKIMMKRGNPLVVLCCYVIKSSIHAA